MSSTTPTLKRHNHRVHPCQAEKKQELLNLLLAQNSSKEILVITSNTSDAIKNIENAKNITIISDEDLLNSPELKAELVISYDLPDKALTYMTRIAHSTTYALILLDLPEEKLLYPIETLIGRTIMQEPIEGFGPMIIVKEEVVKKEYSPRVNDNRGDKPRTNKPYDKDKKPYDKDKKPYDKDKKPYDKDKKPYDKDKKPYDKDKKPYDKDKKPYDKDKKPYDKDKKPYDKDKKPYDKDKKPYDKDKKSSKFLGKDENGKAIFSGKSGERNHRHDGTPRETLPKLTGKKINIKSLKKPESK